MSFATLVLFDPTQQPVRAYDILGSHIAEVFVRPGHLLPASQSSSLSMPRPT
ncbi:hypothetical protein M407DRAFT_35047 [Tulasnella calospora MUT 4182]|uniref:Uncharacterized protein n=1 Tax=Tulasnella calospora MUT 4182 TaxID=1051891 RepID=A0A0C3K1V9_9AGAM|nr:hypothetical protein M407DRAFT_35047 [Tulasnella calospora MUT 4182]